MYSHNTTALQEQLIKVVLNMGWGLNIIETSLAIIDDPMLSTYVELYMVST